jgi:ribosomal protein L21E
VSKIKVGDKVKVKLREPVGNPTTETTNRYLRKYEGRVGEVYDRRSTRTVRVSFPAFGNGTFYDSELEKV